MLTAGTSTNCTVAGVVLRGEYMRPRRDEALVGHLSDPAMRLALAVGGRRGLPGEQREERALAGHLQTEDPEFHGASEWEE